MPGRGKGQGLEPLIDELAAVCSEASSAELLAKRAGFPPSHLPRFETPLVFWHRVVREADAGRLEGGVSALIGEAARQFPGNPTFVSYRARDEGTSGGGDARGSSLATRLLSVGVLVLFLAFGFGVWASGQSPSPQQLEMFRLAFATSCALAASALGAGATLLVLASRGLALFTAMGTAFVAFLLAQSIAFLPPIPTTHVGELPPQPVDESCKEWSYYHFTGKWWCEICTAPIRMNSHVEGAVGSTTCTAPMMSVYEASLENVTVGDASFGEDFKDPEVGGKYRYTFWMGDKGKCDQPNCFRSCNSPSGGQQDCISSTTVMTDSARPPHVTNPTLNEDATLSFENTTCEGTRGGRCSIRGTVRFVSVPK